MFVFAVSIYGCASKENPSTPSIPTPTATFTYSPTVINTPTLTNTPTNTATQTFTVTATATPTITPCMIGGYTCTPTPLPYAGHILVNVLSPCSGSNKAYISLVGDSNLIAILGNDVSVSGFQTQGPVTGTYSVAVTTVFGVLSSGIFYASVTQTCNLIVPGDSGGTYPGAVGVTVNCSANTATCSEGPFQ